jgi:menaquinone-9 beta-reductase
MYKKVDVLIVGGGPAGLAAAVVCARQGLQTMVCERDSLPRSKACGEGLMPHGVRYLDSLGAARSLSPQDYMPFVGIRYFSSRSIQAEGIFKEGSGWGIPRETLSRAFLEAAASYSNVHICQNTPVHSYEENSGRIYARAGSQVIQAHLLVGADGLRSQVRRWAGLEGKPRRHWRWGASLHFQMAPWSRFVEVYWGNGIEAYITPLGEDRVGAAFLWYPGRISIKGGSRLVPSLLAHFPELLKRLRGTPAAGPVRAVGPLQHNATSAAAGRAVLVGDASGYLDAITGEGISLSLGQALALEQSLSSLLKNKELDRASHADFEEYRRAHSRLLRPYFFFTSLALFLSPRPGLQDFALRLLGRKPDLFQKLLSASMGKAFL